MKPKILIVDDAGFVRQILGSMLNDFGFEVIGEARDGQEAIERAARLQPDLVFMDMVLPHKNGAEAALSLLELNPGCLIVGMSTATEEFIRRRAETSGCVQFMEKPFTKATVAAVLTGLGFMTDGQAFNKAQGE